VLFYYGGYSVTLYAARNKILAVALLTYCLQMKLFLLTNRPASTFLAFVVKTGLIIFREISFSGDINVVPCITLLLT